MKSRKLLNTVFLSSLAGAAAFRFFSTQPLQRNEVVKMKTTKQFDPHLSPLIEYDYLKNKLLGDHHHSAIFACLLQRQHTLLTHEQVTELATLAIKHSHARNLDELAGYFPGVITPDWLNKTLVESANRFIFSSLMRKNMKGEIKHLSYLFDPESDLLLIEKSDKLSIAQSGLFNHTKKIVSIDADPYNPSYQYLT